jgi:hypothetical protein
MCEYALMLLLVVAARLLYSLLERPSARRAFWFFPVLADLCLLRSLLHLGYLTPISIALAACFPRARRAVLIGCLAPPIPVLALYVKNWLEFGMFSSSSFFGLAMAFVPRTGSTRRRKNRW